ncbi:hypothetical protein GCK32_007278, partial [Trichostrongylus colubriformis]
MYMDVCYSDDVLCVITEPLQGMAYQFFMQSIMIISILIVICYALAVPVSYKESSVSQEYRRIFDQYLFTGRFKSSVSAQVQHMAMAVSVSSKNGSCTRTPVGPRVPHS